MTAPKRKVPIMDFLATAALLMFTASSVPVEVGKFDPSEYPNLIKLERRLPHGEMVKRVEMIMDQGQCQLDGQSRRRFDITIPYAVLMEGSGRAKKVVVGDIGCKPIELLVGQIVVAQAARGDFPTVQDERWYTSDLNFSLGEPVGALATEQADRMICKRSKPQLGSRLKVVKQCMTAAQWKAFEADRQQLRRDLNNGACRPGAGTC